ncbi:MAG: nitrilase-related carbon-nitrogen hydrolase [Candidatus Binataceae bacterium]
MLTDRFTVALAQVDPRLGDVEANREIIRGRIADAIAGGAELVVFPELALTGYFLKDQVAGVALKADSREFKWLRDLSRRIAIVTGAVEESREALFYNSALYFEAGELRHAHRKCYLPTYGLFDEQRYFARGRRIEAFDTRFGRIACLVCEDMWHPSTTMISALDGALAVFTISCSPISGVARGDVPENAAYWERLIRFNAETWGVYVGFSNRVGFEDGVGFWGGSELVDPFGDTVSKAPYYEPALTFGEIDLQAVRRKRISSTMLRDEELDLTINELARIRGRDGHSLAGEQVSSTAGTAAIRAPVRRMRTKS